MEADHRLSGQKDSQLQPKHRRLHTLHQDSGLYQLPNIKGEGVSRDHSLQANSRKEDMSFVLARVKKDSIAAHSPLKITSSVYNNDYHGRSNSGLADPYGQKVALMRNLQERRSNCPSLYKKSSYEAQYVRPAAETIYHRKESNNHKIFEEGNLGGKSTYQALYRPPQKVNDDTAKPIQPSPQQPFANNQRFSGQSMYQREFVNLPKIVREKSSFGIDHLTDHQPTHEIRQSEYKENFEPKQERSVGKCVPKQNDHYFPQAKNSFSGQFVSSYKQTYH